MQIDPDTRLMELGKDFAKARRLFRRLGFEIDSPTELTISQACDQAGISMKDFARTLVAMTPGSSTPLEEWTQAPLPDLVGYIQDRHHVYTRQALARLGPLLEEATDGHSAQFPELAQVRVHFHNLREDLLQHLDSEDRAVFPAIVEGRTPVFATLDDLHHMALKEHEAVEELLQNIAILTRNFSLPLGAPPVVRSLYLGLRDLEEDLFVHIYLENHILFPRSMQIPANGATPPSA